jgi:predicted DNA-binding transcriptional regulator AlpA
MRLIPHAALKPEKGIPYSAEHLRRMEKENRFPKRVPGRRLWVEAEIDEWIEAWAARREDA